MANESAELAPDMIDLEQIYAFVGALRGGNFSARLPDNQGSELANDLARNLNRFAQDMNVLTGEIKRVCDEIAAGTLGGQVELSLAPGPWRNCVESVNLLGWAITGQIRDMNKTAKLMADGKTNRKVTAPCKGETLELKNALNATIERMKKSGLS